ncbi:hypothetical protein QQ054_28640 [Oscillatoria amoena NRMC-F 0135]|nr:hypothetical protein [Geitlerinema splendidum]MDL5049985.1 hypothetical protein [Oscillatoria amoena NRMC-F 0135]
MSILNLNQSYTFSKLFELRILPEDLANEFGYSLVRKRLNLPQYIQELEEIEALKNRIESVLPYVDLASETSRREVLISQVILQLIQYTKSQLRIEYPIKINEQLQGYLDYLIRGQNNLLVIEAKREDLDYGFTQLIAEMIALDRWERTPEQSILVGAVTTGTIWQFGRLYRENQIIEQGLELYIVPDNLETLMRILVQILNVS